MSENDNIEIYKNEDVGCIADTIYILKVLHNDEGRIIEAYGKMDLDRTASGRFIKKHNLKPNTIFYAFYYIYSKSFSAADGILFDAYLDEMTIEEYLYRISNKEFVLSKLKQIYEITAKEGDSESLYMELFQKETQYDEKIRMSVLYMITNIDIALNRLKEEFEKICFLVMAERAAHTWMLEKAHKAVVKIQTGLGYTRLSISICFFSRKIRDISRNKKNGIMSCLYGIDQNKVYEYDYNRIKIKAHAELLHSDTKRLILETIAKGGLLSAIEISKLTYISTSTVYRMLAQLEREHAIKSENYGVFKYRIDVRYFESAEKLYLDYTEKFKSK